jgi:hypothetical protein
LPEINVNDGLSDGGNARPFAVRLQLGCKAARSMVGLGDDFRHARDLPKRALTEGADGIEPG